MMKDPVLNPTLDRDRFAQNFADHRRVHIPSILTQDSATSVHECLTKHTDFSLVFQTSVEQAQAWRVCNLTPQKESELMTSAYSRAQDGFHYLYDAHMLSRAGEPYSDPSHDLSTILNFLNGKKFLDFARHVTARPDIDFCDAQATRYRPGHFLNQHDDGNDSGRIAAYVLNMTPRWHPDWGGALLFCDASGHIAEGYLPVFNALNIFAVPQAHMVGFVSPFAGAHRYSITGWFRAHH